MSAFRLFACTLALGTASLSVTLPGTLHAAPPAPPPLEAYGDLPAVGDMAISPDGQKLAMIAQAAGEGRIVVMTPERKVIAQARTGTQKVRSIRFAGNDIVLIDLTTTADLGYGYNKRMAEIGGTMIFPLTGGKPELVFSRTISIPTSIKGDYGVRQIDGKWVGYFGGIQLKKDGLSHTKWVLVNTKTHLFAVDLANNAPDLVAKPPAMAADRDWLIDGNGKVAATLDLDDEGKWELSSPDGRKIASGRDPRGKVWLIAFGTEGTSTIYGTVEGDDIRYHEVPHAGGEARPFLADIGLDRLFIDPTNGRMLGYMPDSATNRPVLFDPAKQTTLANVYKAFGGKRVSVRHWTPDFRHFLVATSGTSDPGTWFLVDIAGRKASPIGDERPRIPSEAVGPVSTISYKAADGLEIEGILTLPPGREAKNLPVVILPHGGPRSHDDPMFDWWAQAFASRGYAVLQPNFRGSTNRDRAFVHAGYGQWGRKMQTDLSDGLAELARRGIVDTRRACIMGASYGGYAALAGVTLQNGVYRCSVAVAPVSDLKEFNATERQESLRSKLTQRDLRDLLGDLSKLDEISPRQQAAKADAPVLIIHGKDDTVVPFRQGAEMAEALRRAGKPVELVELLKEDHWLSRGETRMQMLTEAMRFVTQHNPPD